MTSDHLIALKSQALEKFNAFVSNSARQEEWRYTNVSALAKKNFPFPSHESEINLDVLTEWKLENCYHFVLVNGFFNQQASYLPKAIDICALSLESEAEDDDDFESVLENEKNGFLMLNFFHSNTGLYLNLAKNEVLDKPLQILHLTTQEVMVNTYHTVILEENSQATLIETFINNNNQSYLSNSVLECLIENNAELTLYKLQNESEKAFHFGGAYIQQAEKSKFTHHNFALGGLLARSEIHCDLETGSICELNGLYLGKKRQHLDNHTRINHNQPDGISREFYKGILNERARGVFQGLVMIAEQAQKTDSQMNNHNLLLSNNAEIDSKPAISCYADDVKCAHGMTIGQLEEKSIFYLQSRGIDLESAKHMLTFAFANEMVDKITIDSLKNRVLNLLLNQFPQTVTTEHNL
jgi:Fe-S cluster assembly protein SufD